MRAVGRMWMGALLCFSSSGAWATEYFASPAGGGDGKSQAAPFRIADFWSVAQPGDVLTLLDGRYTGSNSMIRPPDQVDGVQGNPITVRAQNDGKVAIDGEGQYPPVVLDHNDWFVLEGFNAHSAGNPNGHNAHVVYLSYSHHNVLRRIVAWDATDGDTNVFAIRHSTHNLLEDCAGWGFARKVFSNSQGGDYTTFRRCFGRWEGSHTKGPKKTFALSYNSYHALVENCIGTWDSLKMKESYTLRESDGSLTSETFDGYEVQAPEGIFSHDGFDVPNDVAHIRILGSIAYLKPNQRYHNGARWWFGPINMSLKGIQLENTLSVVEPGGHDEVRALYLENPGVGGLNSANKLSVLGGRDMHVEQNWAVADNFDARSCEALTANGGHILDAARNGLSGGAQMMKRYRDGVLTNEDLWPWPMNQRIIDAMVAGGYQPVDVTRTVFELCGGTLPASIPSGSVPPPPAGGGGGGGSDGGGGGSGGGSDAGPGGGVPFDGGGPLTGAGGPASSPTGTGSEEVIGGFLGCAAANGGAWGWMAGLALWGLLARRRS